MEPRITTVPPRPTAREAKSLEEIHLAMPETEEIAARVWWEIVWKRCMMVYVCKHGMLGLSGLHLDISSLGVGVLGGLLSHCKSIFIFCSVISGPRSLLFNGSTFEFHCREEQMSPTSDVIYFLLSVIVRMTPASEGVSALVLAPTRLARHLQWRHSYPTTRLLSVLLPLPIDFVSIMFCYLTHFC